MRAKVRWVLDRCTWSKDVIVNCAMAFGGLLFVIAGLYGGFMLLYAMQGMFGTLGCILCVTVAGGGVAVNAYFESVAEAEDAEIEDEIEADYQKLKDEEQQLIMDLREQAEDREIEHQLRMRREIQELSKMAKAEDVCLGEDREMELQLQSIERLHRIRDRLEKLGAECPEEMVQESGAPTKLLYGLRPISEARQRHEGVAEALTEPAEEPPPGAALDGGAAEEVAEAAAESNAAEALRRATLRRRAAASTTATSSGSAGEASTGSAGGEK